VEKENKGRLLSLGRIIFHAGIPIIIVIMILNIWDTSISNDAPMEWNLYVTVASLGAANLVILIGLFVHFIDWKYRYKNPEQR